MRKLLKSRKALSPVVAAIILIAVTVAVSIAVAAWMGALTFTFMKTEELKVVKHEFISGTPNSAEIEVVNSGTAKVTVSEIRANDVVQTISDFEVGGSPRTDYYLDPGEKATIAIDLDWVSGTKYEFAVVTTTNNKFLYVATAPT